MSELTQALANQYFSYNKFNGELRWKVGRTGTAWAGSLAGGFNMAGYIKVKFQKKTYLAHRIIWLLVYGAWPDQIDHIDHNRLNNRLVNLRNVTTAENAKNQSLDKRSGTMISGVTWYKPDQIYRVRLAQKFIGRTADFFEACCIRKSFEFKNGYHANTGK